MRHSNNQTSNEVKQCRDQKKTVLLSLGGATYKEGGWDSAEKAVESAQLLWNKYGPQGSIFATDGFDFDFEVPMTNLEPFTQKLVYLRNEAGLVGRFFLTAAPQCQWPDQNLKDVLNTHMNWFDAIFVQFYNNPECGIPSGYQRRSGGPSARRSGILKRSFNLAKWISLAGQTTSEVGIDVGKLVVEATATSSTTGVATPTPSSVTGTSSKPKIYVGVPGSQQGTTESNMGYVTPDALKAAIAPYMGLPNFGGVSIWDVQYATSNGGFLGQIKRLLGST